MKKIIAVIILICSLFGGAMAEGQSLYLRFGNVIDIEYDSDFVTVDDGLGNLWDFYGVDWFFYDDLVVMIMSDSGTPDWEYDDVVVNAYKVDVDEASEIIREYREKNRKNIFEILENIF